MAGVYIPSHFTLIENLNWMVKRMKSIAKFLVMSMFSFMVIASFTPMKSHAAPVVPSGSGSEGDPYAISSVSHLEWVANQVNSGNSFENKFLELSQNIDASGWEATPIGTQSKMFSGTFDGKNHKISNLTINKSSSDYVGLFGVSSGLATIKNIGIVNANISGKDNVGGLIGRTLGEVRNAYVTGIVSGNDKIGGLIGDNNRRIYDSYSTATVTGNRHIGGLVGYNSGGQIYNSFATGSVSGSVDIGGLTGYNYSDIRNSYATGNVTGGIRVGGFVGVNGGFISNSYATGNLSGEGEIGGFSGYNSDGYGRITSSYWNSDSDIKESNIPQNPKLGVGSDNVVTIAKTVVEMKSADFAQLLNSNRGALEAEWLLASNTNNGFPTFSLMGSGGDEGNSDSESSRDIDITGSVSASIIVVTVPTTLSFAIKTNSETDPFISAPFSVENQTNSPIEIAFLGFKSKEGTTAKVVNADKYPDWGKLPTSKSETEIALGIKTDGKTYWSPAETTEEPSSVIDTVRIDQLGTKVFALDGKHGMAFKQSKVLDYTMYARVGLAS
ncbi:GLUG motif-containing protein [Paenibacillus aceti]|uniref:GLUG domain-containing protein n=1 Tax=Paenibacillus aceti TaxID=1820010 RepID=A0ABQ1VQ61_9BACL|nr:GLUG motif-containing protein [Paenibacillus aceti]GGF89056.1 hypothetical protein GCM10010913_08090 [Paenibacillus aceti]